MTPTLLLATLASGALVGAVLGLIGGGGSILAVPLLIHVVGLGSAHAAIGTAAVAVAANALVGLAGHARGGTVKWRCASLFAAMGMIGAAVGAEVGKAVDSRWLLLLFGLLMVGIGLAMLRPRRTVEVADVRLTRATAAVLVPRLVPAGLGVGLASGFFGIGGGFLIVPALIAATAMPLSCAVGTSLVVVSALGMTTAASYALSGFVDWRIAALMLAGGAIGAAVGIATGKRMAARKGLLERLFAAVVIAVGGYVMLTSGGLAAA